MIELKQDSLAVSFPEVHPKAVLRIDFQRTLRIPDDGTDYPLPPGLGRFPLRHVDDFARALPENWLRRGGVMLPMYQSEAMWLNFSSPNGYPFAVKVAAGKIDAITGDAWTDELQRSPQDFLSIPAQPWLDGFCVAKGVIRQFVAMPLGSGYTVEEQLTNEATHGGLQLLIHPLKPEKYRPPRPRVDMRVCYLSEARPTPARYDMGLAAGGRMRQEIYNDPQRFEHWDRAHRARCFVHLMNALTWRAVTGDPPPTVPPTASEYENAGMPWFDYYAADEVALDGGERLRGVRSITELAKEKKDVPLPENISVTPKTVVPLKVTPLKSGQVREEDF